ncbi:MAG TPA: glycine--tRNA ligase [Methanosarcinales archaeon]|nr:glycine--tRNA ligase [Methanosarcinales archaeon]
MDTYEKIIGLAKRRGFLWNSFELYGGTAGFYDYGPLGATMKRRIEDIWRDLYVIGEGFYEIETPTIGIEPIFVASGHVHGFSDPMTVCSGCDFAFRADHLIEGIVEVPDTLSAPEIKQLIDEHGIKCPQCGGIGTFGEVFDFNLMFRTTVGPGTQRVGYLRPETAQGMFINFDRLFRFYREKIPFGVTQIGKAYRNEISPRQGVIRLREFTQAEAEIFINPRDKNHPKFSTVSNTVLRCYPASHQQNDSGSDDAGNDHAYGVVELIAGDAVDRGIIAHEFLAYHLVLTNIFLIRAGIDPARLRFRQHQPDEMAHYAADCWDAEVLTDRFGWVELVGIADRTDYDLSSHAEHSKRDLSVVLEYETPEQVERIVVKPDMSMIGPLYKEKAGKVLAALKNLKEEDLKGDEIDIKVDGDEIWIPHDMVEYETVTEEVRGEDVIPHVIEPSFGIDRIIYAVLEHSFAEELVGNETRSVLRLPAEVAPVQVAVLPLLTREELIDPAIKIVDMLRKSGIFVSYDDAGTIGRRYRRNDEIGTPFSVTIDYDTLDDDTVTIRDRDSMAQIRVPTVELAEKVHAMMREQI